MNRRSVIYAGSEIVEESFVDVSWEELRDERNTALDQSDWRFMSDQSPSDEWIAYRVMLRDLPQVHFDESDGETQGANTAADAWNDYDKPEGA